jgi:hypothetical protein
VRTNLYPLGLITSSFKNSGHLKILTKPCFSDLFQQHKIIVYPSFPLLSRKKSEFVGKRKGDGIPLLVYGRNGKKEVEDW